MPQLQPSVVVHQVLRGIQSERGKSTMYMYGQYVFWVVPFSISTKICRRLRLVTPGMIHCFPKDGQG